jgi:hypothetical protein
MAFRIEHAKTPREAFGPYRYHIFEDDRLIAQYWHDYRGDEHGIAFVCSTFLASEARPAELDLNPRQAIRPQQQRQFPGVGQVVVEQTPDRLPDRYLLLVDSVGG